eukprot:9490240-Pyramimonas_sp.AAC.1
MADAFPADPHPVWGATGDPNRACNGDGAMLSQTMTAVKECWNVVLTEAQAFVDKRTQPE